MQTDKSSQYLEWNQEVRAPVPPPPAGSCDCQFHIFDDPEIYPPKPDALYDPPNAAFEDMRGVMRALGFQRGVIVHAMPYDTDHRLLVDTLEKFADPESIRAVGIIKENVSDKELEKLDRLGVCAARVNVGNYYNEARSTEFHSTLDRAGS